MPHFLFWNVGRKPIDEQIAAATLSNQVDLVVLAECKSDPNDLLRTLNQSASDYEYAPGVCESLLFFTKFDAKFLGLMEETTRISIRRLKLPAREELIVVGAHLPSKMHLSGESQIFGCVELAKMIDEQEKRVGHRRTILLGDLNVNPFEAGVVASSGLHAVATRDIASKGDRMVQGKRHTFFYNPMWKYCGDRHADSPGTYYYDNAEPLSYFWNTFDQVLIRPDLLSGFETDGLRVLTRAGQVDLVDSRGRPDKKRLSDHLPVLLNIRF
jgi:hypothetical protein